MNQDKATLELPDIGAKVVEIEQKTPVKLNLQAISAMQKKYVLLELMGRPLPL